MENVSEAPANDDQTYGQRSRPSERWMVQRPGFRCLALRDIAGKWRDVFNGKELPDVIEAVQLY